jgi:rhodanese-related sulfurtransferase
MPEAPDHFSRCSAINGRGPTLVRKLPPLEPIRAAAFRSKADESETVVLDTRAYESFGGQHVPGSYHIDFGGNFATFAGWVIPPDKNILLVAASPDQAMEAAVWLRRVGLDRVVGYLDGAMFEWAKAGLPTSHVRQLSAEQLHELSRGKERMTIVDVRAPAEFEGFHIEGAVNIPAPDLRTRYKELDPNVLVATICSTGHRSSLAASILKKNGFTDVANIAGGMTGYTAAGYAPQCPVCIAPHGPRFLGRK